MNEREAFEAWCDQQYGNQAYLHKSQTCGEWDAWQAAAELAARAQSPAQTVCDECNGRGWIAGVCRSGQDDERCGACSGKGAFGPDGRPFVRAAHPTTGDKNG